MICTLKNRILLYAKVLFAKLDYTVKHYNLVCPFVVSWQLIMFASYMM